MVLLALGHKFTLEFLIELLNTLGLYLGDIWAGRLVDGLTFLSWLDRGRGLDVESALSDVTIVSNATALLINSHYRGCEPGDHAHVQHVSS